MYSFKKNSLEVVAAILAVIFVFLLLGKLKVGEYASGFYIVRPTFWKVTPSNVSIEITSFYPTNLTCKINSPFGGKVVEIEPKGSVMLDFNGHFTPGTYVSVPLNIDCGFVKESGEIHAYVFT